MVKTGLFFGSFNPIHIGHLALANYIIEYSDLDKLWFVISPHNPLKKKSSLLADHLRLELVEIAIQNDERFSTCDIEFRMPQPSYTIDTLVYLSEKNPRNEFVIIMGADGLLTFDKWKNADQIIEGYHRIVYPRHLNMEFDSEKYKNISFLDAAPKVEISSSFIRKSIMQRKNIRHFLPPGVFDHIIKYNLYRKNS